MSGDFLFVPENSFQRFLFKRFLDEKGGRLLMRVHTRALHRAILGPCLPCPTSWS